MPDNRTYQEKLYDPQWLARRKEIKRRDGWRCTRCGCERLLEVHHKFYIDCLEPWDYPDFELTTICKWCHEARHGIAHIPDYREKPWP